MNGKKVMFTIAVVGMVGSAFGIIGGLAFQSLPVVFVGLGIWATALIIILAKAIWNYS